MSIEEYIQEYKTMEFSDAYYQCEQHGTTMIEYRQDYPSSGLNGWIDTKQFFGWLGY